MEAMTAPDPDAAPAQPPRAQPSAEAAVEAVEQQISMLWRRTRAISHQMSRNVHPEMEPAAYGLMAILAREGSMRLTDLAAAVGVGKPSVSRQIAFLETLGLVYKEADPLDGRSQAIKLTAKGSEKMREVQSARRAVFQQRLGTWSVEDVQDLARLMAKLNAEYDKDGLRDA